MGEVWKAYDTALARWVALKFLKGGDEEEIARFRREAQTAGRLHHPNIAAIYEVNEDQGRHYIAMQYVEGQTLRNFRAEDRRVFVALLAEAARAVQYAHEQGVVHRDLKPENLMVVTRGAQPHVYVMDFGLARMTEGASNLTVSGFVVGTPAYMPPEQARGERVDARADVYSLGATLYELLTGVRVFDGPNVYELLKRVQEDDPRPPRKIDPRIPPDLETILLKCLAKEAGARYASAAALAEDLSAFAAGEAIRARPEGLSRKLWRRVRRNPAVTLAAAAILLGGGVVGTLATGASRDRRAADLVQRIDARLRAEWGEAQVADVEGLIRELERIAPADAGGARERLKAGLGAAVREATRAADVDRARGLLALLEPRDAAAAGRLREELRQRESMWSAVFALEPPFGELGGVFEKGRARAEGDVLRREPGPADLLETRKPSRGNVELKAEFDPAWRAAAAVGLVLNSWKEGGYQFLLAGPEPREPAAAPPSFEAVHAAKGTLRLQIRRRDTVLREQAVPAASVFGPKPGETSLRLLAKREQDRLTFQVNDLPAVEHRDPFAVAVAARGVFGVLWPAGAGLLRLQANRRHLAEVPGPLQLGDELFLQGKHDQALERYREAALGASSAEVRREARYKEALCHVACNREDSAVPIFEEVGAQFLATEPGAAEASWSFLADCHLLVHHFRRRDGIERARQILEKMAAYRFAPGQISLLIPQDVQRTILDQSVAGGIAGNLHRKPEDLVARMEFGVMASEVLEGPRPERLYKRHGLMRAYWMADRVEDAVKLAETVFAKSGYQGDVLDDYSWILRLRGDYAKAIEAVNRGVSADPAHLVERARVHAARGEWDRAQADLDLFFSKPSKYFHFSAACLLQGFLLERRGQPAEAAWKKGLAKNWRPAPGAPPDEPYEPGANLTGTALLNAWILASLTQDLTDEEGARLLNGLVAFAGKDSPMFNRLMRPSVLRAAWATPRGRGLARRIALRDLPWPDFARYPLYLGWVAFAHEICFPPGPLEADPEELLWQLAQEVHAAYVAGRLNEKYLLPFGMIVQGKLDAPGMGWKEMSALLEPAPRLRGPVAYAFGKRYLKRGDPANAAVFFESAVKDADREPADPRLRRLAREELERIRSK
jgi:tetratricopeptide (TPR) repeat protein